MAKRLFLLFLLCLTGIFANPHILMASDHFLAKAPAFDTPLAATESADTAKSDATPVDTASATPVTASSSPVASSSTSVSTATSSSTTLASTSITPSYHVTTVIGSLSEFSSTYASLSYSDIYRFHKLVYGHNTANLFGSLASLTPGQTFTLNENSAITTYQVANTAYYTKTANGLDGNPDLMRQLIFTAQGHSVALLTCAGTSDGHGDASHRLVIFADAI